MKQVLLIASIVVFILGLFGVRLLDPVLLGLALFVGASLVKS